MGCPCFPIMAYTYRYGSDDAALLGRREKDLKFAFFALSHPPATCRRMNAAVHGRFYWPGVGVGLSVGVGLAVGVAVSPWPGVSIRPIISLIGCFVRNFVSVQRFCVIPGILICDRPEDFSSVTTRTTLPLMRK